MTDFGNPAGFDIATVLTGSGLTLLFSADIIKYGNRFQYSQAELYGLGGGALVAFGIVFRLLLIATGNR